MLPCVELDLSLLVNPSYSGIEYSVDLIYGDILYTLTDYSMTTGRITSNPNKI